MLKYLDEDDYNKLHILYYLEDHHLSTILFEELMEELQVNNYQIKKLLTEIKDEIEVWNLEHYYRLDLQTQKSYVRYERKTQSNIFILLNHYARRSRMQALIRTVFTEEIDKMSDLEEKVFLSKSASYKLLKKFSELAGDYEISINNKLKFTGSEWRIREFTYHFYLSLYGNFYKSFSDEVSFELDDMIKRLGKIDGLFDHHLSSTDQTKLAYRLFIIYTRNYFDHYTKAESFMKTDSPLIPAIKQVLARFLNGSEAELLEESYELLYFLSSEGIISQTTDQLPKGVSKLTEEFSNEFSAAFAGNSTEILSQPSQDELNNIHLRLLVSLRTNFDLSNFNDFSFMQENYKELEVFCHYFVSHLMNKPAYKALVKERYGALVREYMFLLLCYTTAHKSLEPVKICIDFSYGVSYNKYILANIEALGALNLKITLGAAKEDADIYLSNLASLDIKAEQIIWASPPTSYDWEFFGNTVVNIRKRS